MIKVVSCFWNAEKYIGKCIESLQMQKFKDFKVYLIDDMSTDNSVSKIKKLIDGDIRFELIINKEKKFKLRNFDELIRTFDEDDVVIELDGDDWLYLPTVLDEINKTYQDSSVWITNGSFMYSNGSKGFSAKCNALTIRKDAFQFSHLRTWKAFLWKSIPIENFKETNGEYFKSGADVAYTFPLLELAGEKHYKFISSILYVYNANSPYNDHKEGSASGGLNEQSRVANIIRKKTPLKQLFIE
jgi:glycosyltransferase involved in cell wall biosynthesis